MMNNGRLLAASTLLGLCLVAVNLLWLNFGADVAIYARVVAALDIAFGTASVGLFVLLLVRTTTRAAAGPSRFGIGAPPVLFVFALTNGVGLYLCGFRLWQDLVAENVAVAVSLIIARSVLAVGKEEK